MWCDGVRSVLDAGLFIVSNMRWLFGNFATADFRQIWPWHVSRGWNADFGHKFMKSFLSGVIWPPNPKLGGGHSEQVTGQGMHWREILFTPRCSSRSLDNFFVRRTAATSQLPNFRILAYFPHTKRQKSTFGDQPTAEGLHRRMITIFPCGSRRSKGVPSGSGIFLRLLVSELGTPKLAQIFAYAVCWTCRMYSLWIQKLFR